MKDIDGFKEFRGFMIGLIVLFVGIGGLFTFMFFNSFHLYDEFDLDYSDLAFEELTFERYEKKRSGKSSTKYMVYFNEYEEPFEISTISKKKLDREALSILEKGEVIDVYYRESSNRNYDFEICEFSSDENVLLSLPDYIKTNQNNQIAGMIVCPIVMLCSLFLIIIFLRWIKIASDDSFLGKIKIEYTDGENVICVYNSLTVLSLVINGKVVDEYWGIYGHKLSLKGKVKADNRKIPVEVELGNVNVYLYYDGKLVGKKFIGFG